MDISPCSNCNSNSVEIAVCKTDAIIYCLNCNYVMYMPNKDKQPMGIPTEFFTYTRDHIVSKEKITAAWNLKYKYRKCAS